jgi:RNA polymerase sigma-70 factor (ECF subfamily)
LTLVVAPARAVEAEKAPPTPAQILAGVAAGERWAHVALYDTLYPVVARSLQKILHETADYEDLVQASFERIVRALLEPKRRDIDNLAAWASAISARVALDALRRKIRERKLFQGAESVPLHTLEAVKAPSMEKQFEARRQLEALKAVLGRMKSDQAEAIVLHDVLGHDLVEIAKLTSVTVAAAQRRLSRGRQELLRRLGKRETGDAP